MKWEVKYKENLFDGIYIVYYPYIDHRGCATDPYDLWHKDFIPEGHDESFYDYLGAKLID